QSLFTPALLTAYHRLATATGSYVDAYAVRALVCVELGIQPDVFAVRLKQLIELGQSSELLVYTELPFSSTPPGESYIEIGRSRIGRLKVSTISGGPVCP